LTKTDSGNAGWQSDLSVSQGKVGDVLLAQGHLPAALESLHNALVIRERLAQAALEMPCRSTTCFLERLAQNDPANAEWHRDVALSHGRVATVRARLVVSSSPSTTLSNSAPFNESEKKPSVVLQASHRDCV
jgi:hypothetical protein